jgi:hypothetical protein
MNTSPSPYWPGPDWKYRAVPAASSGSARSARAAVTVAAVASVTPAL